ncbi:MAG TPA: hypothetical protein VFK20_16660 [Vicinamibacterales bacterium]|nr:hypothetical protein [Vicinamibacterales bacterium]
MFVCAPDAATVHDWIRIVQGEYQESPGLSLTYRQVQRMWNLDAAVCDAVLEHLQATGFLRLNARGMYVRNGSLI